MRAPTRLRVLTALRFVTLVLLVTIFFLPIVSMLATSLKRLDELYRIPASILPQKPVLENYVLGWTMINFGKYFLNSLLLTALYIVPAVMSSCFAGYAFARFRVRESNTFFVIVLATLMVPTMVTIMPFYMILTKIGFLDQRLLWVLLGLPGLPFVVFLFRQFFSTIPASLEESARIDGAGRLRIFFSIMFPLVKTGLVIAFIFAFQWSWSEYLAPVLFLSDDKTSLAVKIMGGYSDQKENILYNVAMAGVLYYTLPLVLIFFAMQKRFVAGLLEGGIKG
ncbi:MAG: carbohydrate ABC transporter permease [Spirochaetota bacterium]